MIVPAPRCALLVASSVPIAAVLISAFPEGAGASLYLPILALILSVADLYLIPQARLMKAELDHPVILHVGAEEEFRIRVSLLGEEGEYGSGEGDQDSPPPKLLRVRFFLEALGDLGAPEPQGPLGSSGKEGRAGAGSAGAGSVDPFDLRGPVGPLSGEIVIEGGKGELTLPLRAARRGKLRLLNLWLSWRGPLNFLEARKKVPLDITLDTVQNVKGLHEEALKLFTRDISTGLKIQRHKGAGSEFESLSEYATGMDTRYVDWKRSARHLKLLVKEYRPEKNNQIILCFDTGRLMTEPIEGSPRLDHFVRAGLSLGWVSLRSGDLVGACGFDITFRNFLAPGRTPSFFLKLQKFSSNLNYENLETNFTLCLTELSARLKQRSLIVLFTEFGDGVAASLLLECLELMRRKHLVIFVSIPDPLLTRLPDAYPRDLSAMAESVIASGFQRERAIVLERMNRLGVYSIDAELGKLSGALINRYVMIKQRGLL